MRRLFLVGLCLGLCTALPWFLDSDVVRAANEPTAVISETPAEGAVTQHALGKEPRFLLIGMGDSLTHGTMDATNNFINTFNAYLQRIAFSLASEVRLHFRQPFFDLQEKRIRPFLVPTNLAVDGADAFTVEGISYYKRAGTDESVVSPDLLADKLLPWRLKDNYDKVLYPINLLARQPMSQIDSAIWLLNRATSGAGVDRILVMFWVGNNDSGSAALGAGGSNPEFLPIPLDEIAPEIKPLLRLLLEFGRATGVVSFEPYTQAAIERNLTDLGDFVGQYDHLLTRLEAGSNSCGAEVDYLLLTLPYYSAVGYLFDSDDLEFYLQKINDDYLVPTSFKTVPPPGEPVSNPFQGDRVSLLTFGFMYVLLASGYSVDYVNQILEMEGQQQDGLVLSEEEQRFIMSRIDDFNETIKTAAASRGPNFHLIDIGQHLNDTFTGKTKIIVNDKVLSRKWIRGGGFSFDGVHPGYTGQSVVTNFIVEQINAALCLDAPLYDLSPIHARDPYVDHDEDGWAPGPNYEASGLSELLFLFKDPDDTDLAVGVELPPDVWDLISDILLREILDIPAIQAEAKRLGMSPLP